LSKKELLEPKKMEKKLDREKSFRDFLNESYKVPSKQLVERNEYVKVFLEKNPTINSKQLN
jgi:hypothetical protein